MPTYDLILLICILDYESLWQDNRHYEFRSVLLMPCPFETHINRARTERTEIMNLSYSYTACTSSHTIEIRVRHFEDEMCAPYKNKVNQSHYRPGMAQRVPRS